MLVFNRPGLIRLIRIWHWHNKNPENETVKKPMRFGPGFPMSVPELFVCKGTMSYGSLERQSSRYCV